MSGGTGSILVPAARVGSPAAALRRGLRPVLARLSAALVVAALPFHAAGAGPEDCPDATDQYALAVSVLSDAIQVYAGCIVDSNGRDDCSIEFSRLQLAQDNFVLTVAQYQSECP